MDAETKESFREPAPEAFQESGKLFFDLMKHLTTLSTGSIVLLVTFVEKLFPSPSSKWLIVVVLSSLILSVTSSLLAMLILVRAVKVAGETSNTEQNIGAATFFSAVGFFLLGLITLVVFAGVNIH